jgi:hypothetical protein
VRRSRTLKRWEIIMAFDSKTAETNKAVTRRFMEEFKNEHIFACDALAQN